MNPGDCLDRFRLVELLGTGPAGEVWRANVAGSDADVAVRVLLPAVAGDSGRRARLEQAARELARIEHPGLARIESIEQAAGRTLVVMEWVRGAPLGRRFADGGMETAEWLRLALPLTDAVAAAHDAGLIHGDLKPRNVLVWDDGSLKVLDFGMADVRARVVDPDDAPTLTLTNDRGSGATSYVSPEQIQGKGVDLRSDVFSLGAILYEMATGRHPFRADSPADVFVSILRDAPPPATQLNPRLPVRVDRVFEHALEKDRERRFQHTRDLHEVLSRLGD